MLKQAITNSARCQKRHKKKILDLAKKVKNAEKELVYAIAHGEAEVHKVLKRKAEDEKGWQRQVAEAEHCLTNAEQCAASSTEELKTKLGVLGWVRGVLRLMQRQLAYQKQVREHACNSSPAAKHVLHMQAKWGWAYKVELRALARVLVSCGCKEASQVQLGVEMKYTKDITMSSDSTSRRKLNYQSHHIHMRVPVKNPDGSASFSAAPTIRFAGIASTVNHSTETSKTAWLNIYDDIMSTYNASPLGQRLGLLDLHFICRRLRRMCGDHANNKKAPSNASKELKNDVLLQELGEQRLQELDGQIDELQTLCRQWVAHKYDDAGGFEAYMCLPPEEKAARDLASVHAMTRELSEQALKDLNKADRRLLTVWVWTGCCMHKDQNSFKGGNTHMTAYCKELGIPGPIRLANKDSAAAVRSVLHPEDGDKPASEDDLERVENAAFSGAKAAALAGAIFENAIEKCRQGDQVELYLRAKVAAGAPVKRFAKTNQTCFGSHGDAACELVARREIYREFLEAVKNLKTRPGWTNIEKNVLIDNPELILDFDKEKYELATFDGKPVARNDVLVEIKRLHDSGKLPYLKQILVRLLEGAKATWIRFSSEFAPGGVIDGLNDAEKGSIWLPATNDRNEGALRSFIGHMHDTPTAALATHNGLAMFKRNATQAFMDMWFEAEDHQYVMKVA
ncbi:hypothetical protein DFH07DRAFT_776983 [Mycena maculata]|uniref:Uncharacterized protein n=1 Tax=Mycena maculata TaxID=230809 RepID=A0AAD7IJW0_9AGAR|nr:hypothetical protein DFH07DRAFT_776983 [Mycena maculata]